MSNTEIMAPVGSYESLSAALRAGADSVYFGVGNLNMRARASVNFQLDDLKKIAEKCRRLKVKSYLVLNTIVYDSELDEIKRICDAAKESAVSAIIASDIAVLEYARSIGLEIHISVQANVSNVEALRFYSKYADVMVLARELKLPQIRNIIETIKSENICGPSGELVRIELFAHGALCVAISGKCYMSLGQYNSSANRGACYQNCRRAYRITDEQTGDELIVDNNYVMSPKDLCTISFLNELIKAGVAILKIEGRGRSSDYVSTVVGVYKDAVNSIEDGTYSEEKTEKWIEKLGSVFNRGFWHGGYYLGEDLGEWCNVDGNISEMKKEYIGEISNYFSRLGVAEMKILAGCITIGQELLFTGPTTGAVRVTIDELRLDRNPVENAEKGDIVSIPVPVKLRRRDKIYLLTKRKFGEEK